MTGAYFNGKLKRLFQGIYLKSETISKLQQLCKMLANTQQLFLNYIHYQKPHTHRQILFIPLA